MGTRNHVWGRRQRAGGPLEKLLFLHICDAIPERGEDPRLETSIFYLMEYCETSFWLVSSALDRLEAAKLISVDRDGERLFLRIPFPQQAKAPLCPRPVPSSPSSA